MHGQRRSVDAIGWSDRAPTRENAGRSAFHQVGRMQSASFACTAWPVVKLLRSRASAT